MQSHKLIRAITLIEILMVTVILMILMSVLWMVLAPSATRAAHRADVKVGLKRALAGFNIYRADHDDKYPLDWKGMGFTKRNTPEYIAQGADEILDAPVEFPGSYKEVPPPPLIKTGTPPLPVNYNEPALLIYMFWGIDQAIMNQYLPDYPVDEAVDPFFVAMFTFEGGKVMRKVPAFNEKKELIHLEGQDTSSLSVFGDGHVDWSYLDGHMWWEELNYYKWYGGLRR